MENNVNGAEVAPATAPAKHKSNAAWITGLVGFCIAIPNLLYIWLCAVANTVSKAADEVMGVSQTGSTESEYTKWIIYLIIFALLCTADFVLCFMGKGEKSKLTGTIMIAVAALIIILSFIFSGVVLALVTGGLYIASGIVSIKNQELPA